MRDTLKAQTIDKAGRQPLTFVTRSSGNLQLGNSALGAHHLATIHRELIQPTYKLGGIKL